MNEDAFFSHDGLRIFFRNWKAKGHPRGIVIINHGFNSHSGQYGWVAQQLAKAGFSVFAIDMRGRGRSEGRRFRVDDVSEYVSDLHALVGLAKARVPGLPLFLLGHSAGGVAACSYALEHQAELAGLICESFAFKVPAPNFVLSLVKWLSRFLPNLPVLRLRNEDFSRNLESVAALNNDPLIHREIQPAITVAALARADEQLERDMAKITLPLLILHGTADKATLASGSQFFATAAASKIKTLKLYDGHYHDLLNDLGKEFVLADIMTWIDERLASKLGNRVTKRPAVVS